MARINAKAVAKTRKNMSKLVRAIRRKRHIPGMTVSFPRSFAFVLAFIVYGLAIIGTIYTQPDRVSTSQPSKPVAKIAGVSATPVQPAVQPTVDHRVAKLEGFLRSYGSPLTEHAEVFIEAADTYDLDWRWVPAIAGVESTFGRHIPADSYNAYGWANGRYRFASWEDSIYVVTKALRENYVDRGADSIAKIAPIYAPPSTTWAGKVRYFIARLDAYQPSSSRDLALLL